ncbi:target of Nesh-SH3 isoform X2 [Neoarius graeffei]|uniref:target of Nesh-SH3 isoform X2 n=1 Tax=Neoarius graeffei TaxID=443677 RepID=UPI00298BFAE5|nr:target of Nesh-SH3 isoform X2 [Neoarius graeffei]
MTVFLLLLILSEVLLPNLTCASRVHRQTTKVRISATGDTIMLKFLQPHMDTKLEGYILGYGSSLFSKQFIQLPVDGEPYETEIDAEPKYLVAVQPIQREQVKKPCTGKETLEKPLHLLIGSVTQNSVKLSWGTLLNSLSSETNLDDCIKDGQYTVRYREKDPEEKWNYQTCPTTDTIIDQLKPDTPYEFGVRAEADNINGAWSPPVTQNTAEKDIDIHKPVTPDNFVRPKKPITESPQVFSASVPVLHRVTESRPSSLLRHTAPPPTQRVTPAKDIDNHKPWKPKNILRRKKPTTKPLQVFSPSVPDIRKPLKPEISLRPEKPITEGPQAFSPSVPVLHSVAQSRLAPILRHPAPPPTQRVTQDIHKPLKPENFMSPKKPITESPQAFSPSVPILQGVTQSRPASLLRHTAPPPVPRVSLGTESDGIRTSRPSEDSLFLIQTLTSTHTPMSNLKTTNVLHAHHSTMSSLSITTQQPLHTTQSQMTTSKTLFNTAKTQTNTTKTISNTVKAQLNFTKKKTTQPHNTIHPQPESSTTKLQLGTPTFQLRTAQFQHHTVKYPHRTAPPKPRSPQSYTIHPQMSINQSQHSTAKGQLKMTQNKFTTLEPITTRSQPHTTQPNSITTQSQPHIPHPKLIATHSPPHKTQPQSIRTQSQPHITQPHSNTKQSQPHKTQPNSSATQSPPHTIQPQSTATQYQLNITQSQTNTVKYYPRTVKPQSGTIHSQTDRTQPQPTTILSQLHTPQPQPQPIAIQSLPHATQFQTSPEKYYPRTAQPQPTTTQSQPHISQSQAITIQSQPHATRFQTSTVKYPPRTVQPQPTTTQSQPHTSQSQTIIIQSQPHATQFQTSTVKYHPRTVQPQPTTTQSQPHRSQSQTIPTQSQHHTTQSQSSPIKYHPRTTQPQPTTAQSQPHTSQSQTITIQSQPHATQLQTSTVKHHPRTVQPQPTTTQSQPHTPQSQTITTQSQPHTTQSQNSTVIHHLGTTQTQPTTTQSQPHTTQSQNNTVIHHLGTTQTQPTTTQSQPHTTQSQPHTTQSQPHPIKTQSNSTKHTEKTMKYKLTTPRSKSRKKKQKTRAPHSRKAQPKPTTTQSSTAKYQPNFRSHEQPVTKGHAKDITNLKFTHEPDTYHQFSTTLEELSTTEFQQADHHPTSATIKHSNTNTWQNDKTELTLISKPKQPVQNSNSQNSPWDEKKLVNKTLPVSKMGQDMSSPSAPVTRTSAPTVTKRVPTLSVPNPKRLPPTDLNASNKSTKEFDNEKHKGLSLDKLYKKPPKKSGKLETKSNKIKMQSNQVDKDEDKDKVIDPKLVDTLPILKPSPAPPTTEIYQTPTPTTTPFFASNGSWYNMGDNSSVFSPFPVSEVDSTGKKRFVAPHVIYQIDKSPEQPCSVTHSLSFFPDEENGVTNITGPPKTPPTNLTVVTVEGCPSFVIIDWEKTDNETKEYEVTSSVISPNGHAVSVVTTNQTHTAVENLKPESSYEFTVTPKNELGSGPSSEPVSFSTESADPRVSEIPSGKNAIWSSFSFKADSYSECTGTQYVKRTWYRKFVGIQLCNSLRYKIYLSDSLKGKFYDIGDEAGYGEDHCQFVDSYLDGRTGGPIPAYQLPLKQGYFRSMRQEPVKFGKIGGNTHINYVAWYECGVPIPGSW